MIKRFFTVVFGSLIGAWIALMLFCILSFVMSFAILGSMAGSMTNTVRQVEDNTILHINLTGTFPERSDDSDYLTMLLSGEDEGGCSLGTTLKAIEIAKNNDKIKGIYIECNGNGGGLASLYEIRKAIEDFKKSGKFVVAYGNEGISQGDYYVASAANEVYLNPVGAVDVHGLSATIPFYKKLLDNLGIEMQVIRVGTFKSAVEPFIATEASDANRLQTEVYMKSIWGTVSEEIAKSRKMTVDKVNMLADSILVTKSGEELVAEKVVDQLCYKFEMEEKLKMKAGINKDDDLRMATPIEVCATEKAKDTSDDVIAVVYAEGEIDGNGEDGVDSNELTEELIEISKDKNVKGVVLRVNSPGGSAFGSEQIWKALEEVKKAGKVYAVSMGDLAASGGYYISCGADRIFAEPVTITGSIGIFGMIPCFKTFLEDKIGVTQSVISTNANGNFVSVTQPMTATQQASMQKMINRGYALFTSRCAKGRNMPIDSLQNIAQGRVWDGATAKKLGLVDAFGNLNDAIAWVKEKAKISEYTRIDYPKEKNPLLKYLDGYMSMKMEEMVASETGELYKYRNVAKQVMNRDRVQCMMEPIEIK